MEALQPKIQALQGKVCEDVTAIEVLKQNIMSFELDGSPRHALSSALKSQSYSDSYSCSTFPMPHRLTSTSLSMIIFEYTRFVSSPSRFLTISRS